LVFIDLSEDGGLVAGHRVIPRAWPLRQSPNRSRKGHLGARQETDGHKAILGCTEAACAHVEHAGGELVADFRGSRSDSMKAEIAHGVHSLHSPHPTSF